MNRVYGYSRVSRQSQSLDRQADALMARGCHTVFTEKMSGVKADRPELTRLKEALRPGDTVIVESWSRLGRSTRDLVDLTEWFRQNDVTLVSIKENFDTATPQGKMMLTVFQAFAEFERDLIAQRTREGLASARARGRLGGRPAKPPRDIAAAIKLYRSRLHPVSEISRLTGVSASTLYRYLKKNEGGTESPS